MQTLWCMYVLVLSCKIRPDVPLIFLYTALWSVTSLPLLSRFYFHSPWSWASFDNWSDTVQFPGEVSRVLAASAFALGRLPSPFWQKAWSSLFEDETFFERQTKSQLAQWSLSPAKPPSECSHMSDPGKTCKRSNSQSTEV